MSLIKSNFPNISDFFSDENWGLPRENANWIPAINVLDNEGEYAIEVAAPGIKKEDFNVQAENGILTITGHSKQEEEEKKKNYTRKEFSSRSFRRSFTMPDNVNVDGIKAKYEDGVLKLKLAKTEPAEPKKLEVEIS